MIESNSRTYLILGATGGIGSALARRLVANGDRVMLAARDPDKLEALAKELDAPSSRLESSDFVGMEAAVGAALETFERLDGTVNCIGSLLLKPAHLTNEQELRQTLDTHVVTAFGLVRAAARAMRATGGSIVLVSSSAARIGLSNHEAIAVAKGAIEGLVRAAAMTYARNSIRINAVAPGLTRTPLTERITGNTQALAASLALHGLNRVGEPDDVADAVAWLLGRQSSWVTGQVLGIDGGLATLKPMPSSR